MPDSEKRKAEEGLCPCHDDRIQENRRKFSFCAEVRMFTKVLKINKLGQIFNKPV